MSRKLKIGLTVGITIFIGLAILIWVGFNAIQKEIVLSDTYPENGPYKKVAISPNEERIAFSYFKKREGSIFIADNKGDVKELARPKPGYHYINPMFFENGKQLLFLSSSYEDELKQRIYIMNVDGTGLKRLTPENELVTEAVISPNGNKVYYIKAAEFYGEHPGVAAIPHDHDLYSIDIDGTNNERITNFSTEFMLDLSISEDGEKLGMVLDPYDKNDKPIKADIKNSKNEEEYVVYDIISKKFTALPVPLSGGIYETVPMLSPNGKKVAFNNDRISEDDYFDYELSEMDLETQEITSISSLDIESKVYTDDNTLYFIYDKDDDEEKQDLRLAKINSDGSGFSDVFNFNEMMKH
jgi:Tol biopolymer transport system component